MINSARAITRTLSCVFLEYGPVVIQKLALETDAVRAHPCSRDQLDGLNRGLGVDSCELGEDERDAIEDEVRRFGVVGELVSCAAIALGERPAASALR